jgi:hypothetical protein
VRVCVHAGDGSTVKSGWTGSWARMYTLYT